MTFPRPKLSWISNALFLLIVGCAVVITLLSRQTEILGWRGMIVRSGSMEPAISTGSVILVQRQDNYDVNDIVTYQNTESNGVLITHRVKEKQVDLWKASFVTQGDANPVEDTKIVQHQDILGKTKAVIPYLGYIVSFLQTPLGVTLAIVIPATILIYEQFKQVHKAVQERGKAAVIVAAVALAAFTPLQQTWAIYATSAQISAMSMTTAHWVDPSAEIQVEEDAVKTSIRNSGGLDKIKYVLKYSHLVEGERIEEVVEGTVTKDLSEDEAELPDLYLGTCSEVDCSPHLEIEDLVLKITFFADDEELHSIEENISL